MTKKILKVILKIFVLFVIYLIQIFVLNNVTFFGVKANIPLMLLVIWSMTIDEKIEVYVYAVIIGILNDILFSSILGEYLLINILLTTIITNIKNTYKQDNKFSVIIFSVLSTVIFEIFVILFNVISKQELENVFLILFTIFKLSVINLFFAYVIYLIWTRCINKLGDNNI